MQLLPGVQKFEGALVAQSFPNPTSVVEDLNIFKDGLRADSRVGFPICESESFGDDYFDELFEELEADADEKMIEAPEGNSSGSGK